MRSARSADERRFLSMRKLAKSCIATEQERKAFYKELLQIGLEDIDSLEEQRINEIIQKYISE